MIVVIPLTAQQLEQVFIEPTEIRKFQVKQAIHDEVKNMELSKTLVDTIDIFIDKMFEIFIKRKDDV